MIFFAISYLALHQITAVIILSKLIKEQLIHLPTVAT